MHSSISDNYKNIIIIEIENLVVFTLCICYFQVPEKIASVYTTAVSHEMKI